MIWPPVPAPASAAVAGPDAAPERPPVRAVVRREGATVTVRLIGDAIRPVAVRYRLVTDAGGNRATQAGTARLAPGVPTTLLDLAQSAAGNWSAVLELWVEGGRSFHLALTAPAGREGGGPGPT